MRETNNNNKRLNKTEIVTMINHNNLQKTYKRFDR
jgi:hypothetical protein